MALFKRKTSAAAAGPSKDATLQSAKKQAKADKKAVKAEAPAAADPAASGAARRRLLGWLALLGALYSAASEWPVYLAYEKDWRRPAIGFTMNFSITAAVALLVACSPPVRALKPRPGAAAEAGSGLSRATKRKVAVTFFLVVLPLYYGFGAYGPSGAVTVAGLMAFIFLALP